MSMILGVHLLERLYLVSDTRLTEGQLPDGTKVYSDDFIKFFPFNERIGVVAAGSALGASYILNKLVKQVSKLTSIDELMQLINDNLAKHISDFVNETGKYGEIAFTIGGFNPHKLTKSIDVVKLGEAMSGQLVAAGEGSMMNQSIDSRLIAAMPRLSGKGKGDRIEIENVQESKMYSVVINIQTAEFKIKEIDTYDYVTFHPEQGTKNVSLPREILSALEFRERSKDWESNLYQESETLINFFRKIVREEGFSTVGGHIFPVLQIPETNMYPTGNLGRNDKNGMLVNEGGIFASNGQATYEYKDGKKGVFRSLTEYVYKAGISLGESQL